MKLNIQERQKTSPKGVSMFKSEGKVAAHAAPVWHPHWLQQSHPEEATHQPSSPSTVRAQWVNFYFLCIKTSTHPGTGNPAFQTHPCGQRGNTGASIRRPMQTRCGQQGHVPITILTRWTLCSGSRRWADAGTSTWTCARWPGGSCASRHLVAFL